MATFFADVVKDEKSRNTSEEVRYSRHSSANQNLERSGKVELPGEATGGAANNCDGICSPNKRRFSEEVLRANQEEIGNGSKRTVDADASIVDKEEDLSCFERERVEQMSNRRAG